MLLSLDLEGGQMSIHVVLISQEPLANGIPVAMDRPCLVVAVCTEMATTKKLDQKMAGFLEKLKIPIRPEKNAPDANLFKIRDWATDLLNRLERDFSGEKIVLNLTGGNKIMSLGFWEAFKDRASRIIYTDTAHDCIEILSDKDLHHPPTLPMGEVLNVKTSLSIQGLEYLGDSSDNSLWRKTVDSRKSLTDYLASKAPALKGLFSSLNAMAGQKGGAFPRPPSGEWKKAIDHIVSNGLADWKSGSCEISFANPDASHYMGGGWLEEYAFLQAEKAGFKDVRANVKVRLETEMQVDNELDIVICHRNRLFILECKTGRMNSNSASKNDPTDIAYKSEVLRQAVGGRFAETYLLLAQPPTQGLTNRAKDLRITLVTPEELSNLKIIFKKVLDRFK